MFRKSLIVILVSILGGAFVWSPLGQADGAKAEPLSEVVARKVKASSVSFRPGTTLAEQHTYLERLSHYLDSLALPDSDKALNLLLRSVTQFVMCDDLEDWTCLEALPVIEPKTEFRVEDPSFQLGRPRIAGPRLDAEWWMTKRFYKGEATNFLSTESTFQSLAARLVSDLGSEFVWGATYGLNDTGVFSPNSDQERAEKAILAQRNYNSISGAVIAKAIADAEAAGEFQKLLTPKAVKDAKDRIQAAVSAKLRQTLQRYSMAEFGQVLKDLGLQGRAQFVFDFESRDLRGNKGMFFQYRDSPKFALAMSEARPGEWPGRIEWADDGIMHNKFLVMKNPSGLSLLAGTGNFSDTCMGLEVNTNMFVLIRNESVAQSYLQEFKEMFGFVERSSDETQKIATLIPESFRVGGRFHTKKKPNTPRYFVFEDGTEVRVNFSPTDDATHRVIIPFLRGSKAGDTIRISMMGNGEPEIVRAIQWALSRGANVKILLDNKGGAVPTSWRLHREANLLQRNPFAVGLPPSRVGKLEIRNGDWIGGMHHQKIATRVRQGKATEIIIGSQNWSAGGNDSNDENLLQIRNRESGVEMAEDFNRHFDREMWPFARRDWSN